MGLLCAAGLVAGDLGRVFGPGPGGDRQADGAYRVNPADKERGRRGQEHFRDSLEQRKHKQGELADPQAQAAPEAGEAGAADAFDIQDRVSLSSQPAAAKPEGSTTAPQAKEEQGVAPKPEDDDSNRPPPAAGRVNVLA